MPFTGDERQISLEEVVSAAVTHELPILVERLARERLGYAKPGETVIRFDAPATNALVH